MKKDSKDEVRKRRPNNEITNQPKKSIDALSEVVQNQEVDAVREVKMLTVFMNRFYIARCSIMLFVPENLEIGDKNKWLELYFAVLVRLTSSLFNPVDEESKLV